MLKHLLSPLLAPLAARLEKLQNRMTQGFKRVESQQADAKQKTAERLNMLSRQVDEARNEFHRGFRIQEDFQQNLQSQLNEVLTLLRMQQGNRTVTHRPPTMPAQQVSPADSNHAKPLLSSDTPPTTTDPTLHDSMVEMMLGAGRDWLAAQGQHDAPAQEPLRPPASGPVSPTRSR
ncbi:hypothetical protein DES53_10469 [Roseimicrobium gellanilyticum]|uniref:Uncharacterized protein n=1 Tax=Roseimicrobium gellanilyticum TaxID=748857 RepID=A0A366HP74_9BACT|nr:hypothetical protein [Roseimicrobium gellanilyticum]RBP44250.1 hypothetical protein DES53_10469 [Roseimicrobium gellanilyticum]